LDILFAENHYPKLVETSLGTEWILQTDKSVLVITIDINSILGDKLTAFAPNTTGIPYNAEKEKEILKQLFDIGNLFDLLTDITVFKNHFWKQQKGKLNIDLKEKLNQLNKCFKTLLIQLC
jgi:hypothetical protein